MLRYPSGNHPAFLLEDEALLEDFTRRYVSTKNLHFRGQVPFADIITNIKAHLHRM